MKDRDYQTRMFEGIRAAFAAGHKRVLAVLPTGGGKGYMAGRTMQLSASKRNRALFLAASRQLIFQLHDQLDSMNTPSNVLMAGVENEYASAEEQDLATLCTVASRGTIHSRGIKRAIMDLPPADIVHVDEAHEAIGQSYLDIFAKYKDAWSLGWTATPCRTDGRSLGRYYDHMVTGPTYKELQELGMLVPCKVIAPDRPNLKGLKVSKGDYHQGEVEKLMNRDKMVGDIIAEWKKNAGERSAIVFASGIKHSLHIRNEFHDAGITAVHIDGKTESNELEDILGKARDGKIKVVTNFGVATTGVDVPRWKYMICARPTKSFLLWRQMGGRIQRPFPGHDHCMIQDHSACCEVHGYPDEDVEWTLDGETLAQDLPRTERNKPPNASSDPFKCKECGKEYRGPHCPNCGHRPERDPEEIKMEKGKLKELERKKLNRETSLADKQKAWDNLLGEAIGKGLKVGSCFHRYKEKFGVQPDNRLQGVPRASQWRMYAKDFYREVVKPEREKAKREAESESQEFLW